MKRFIAYPIGEQKSFADVGWSEADFDSLFPTSILVAEAHPLRTNFTQIQHQASFVSFPHLNCWVIIPSCSLEGRFAVIAMVSRLIGIEMRHQHVTPPACPFALPKRTQYLQSLYSLFSQPLTVKNLGT